MLTRFNNSPKRVMPIFKSIARVLNLVADVSGHALMRARRQFLRNANKLAVEFIASIARRVAAQRDITRICNRDILKFCGSVTPGDANILSCMMAVRPSAISPQCNQAFTDTGWRTETVQQ
jgi:hypothetical protein